MMMRSPGAALSTAVCSGFGRIAPKIVLLGLLVETRVGALPPIVTVTVSIDFVPLLVVMMSSPHCAVGCPVCCKLQFGTPVGTVTLMLPSVHDCIGAFTRPIVTEPCEAPKP